jgi:predicted amidophosphoribosyltransferase
MDLIDYIFPKKCVICKKQGSYLCEGCFAFISFNQNPICLICKKFSKNNLTHKECLNKYSIDGYFSALSYSKTVEKLIHDFKEKPYLKDLSLVLSELFYESIIQNENFYNIIKKLDPILAPVPLNKEVFKKRGYAQSGFLAKNLSKYLNIKTFSILERKNSEFVIKSGFDIKNLNIILVDDISRSGFTLISASKVLKKYGAKRVFGLTLVKKTNKKP